MRLFELINKLSNTKPDDIIYESLTMAYIPTACNGTVTNHVAYV